MGTRPAPKRRCGLLLSRESACGNLGAGGVLPARFFAETSFGLALFRSGDHYHREARAWQNYLIRTGARLITTDAVCWGTECHVACRCVQRRRLWLRANPSDQQIEAVPTARNDRRRAASPGRAFQPRLEPHRPAFLCRHAAAERSRGANGRSPFPAGRFSPRSCRPLRAWVG